MAQLSYSFSPNVATEGMIAEAREAVVVISKLAQGLVPVGKLCAPGTNSEIGPDPTGPNPLSTTAGQVIALPAGIVANPILDYTWTGVPIYDSSRPPYDASLGYSSYANQDPCPVLIKGTIWVKSEGVMLTEANPVLVRVAASGPNTVLGVFAWAPGPGLVAFPRGRWRSADNANGLAILEIW